MSTALPWILMVMASGMLFVALLSLWQSLRAAFGVASVEQVRGIIESEERAALMDEKASLLRSLRDLELDHDSDKISDADFERLNRRLRGRARDVLKMLDQDVQAYRPAAEAMIAEAMSEAGQAPYRSAAGEAPASPERAEAEATATASERTGEAAPRVCAGCTTSNDPDAMFCKKCGTRLEVGEDAS